MEMTFSAKGTSQEQLFAQINGWFAANQNITVSRIYTDTKTSFGLLVNKSQLANVTIIYEPNNKVNTLYGFDYVEKFSLMKISMEKMKARWIEKNPHLQYVCCSYSHNARGQAGNLVLGGIGAKNRNQIWIVYKVLESTLSQPTVQTVPSTAQTVPSTAQTAPSTAQTAQPTSAPANAPVACPNCGYNENAGALFCGACGFKLQ